MSSIPSGALGQAVTFRRPDVRQPSGCRADAIRVQSEPAQPQFETRYWTTVPEPATSSGLPKGRLALSTIATVKTDARTDDSRTDSHDIARVEFPRQPSSDLCH